MTTEVKEDKKLTSIKVSNVIRSALDAGFNNKGLDILPETLKTAFIEKLLKPLADGTFVLNNNRLTGNATAIIKVEDFIHEMEDGLLIMPRVAVEKDGKLYYSTDRRDYNYILNGNFEFMPTDIKTTSEVADIPVEYKVNYFRQVDGGVSDIQSIDALTARDRYFARVSTKIEKVLMFSIRLAEKQKAFADIFFEEVEGGPGDSGYTLAYRYNPQDMTSRTASYSVLEDDVELLGSEVRRHILCGGKIALMEIQNDDFGVYTRNLEVVFSNFIDIIGVENIVVDDQVYITMEGCSNRFPIFVESDIDKTERFNDILTSKLHKKEMLEELSIEYERFQKNSI